MHPGTWRIAAYGAAWLIVWLPPAWCRAISVSGPLRDLVPVPLPHKALLAWDFVNPLAMRALKELPLALLAFVAFGTTCWALLLTRKIQAQGCELDSLFEMHRRGRQFRLACNRVLDSITNNAPVPESMELLALALEQQAPGSLCAIVIPAETKSSFSEGTPVLIAPGLSEKAQLACEKAFAALPPARLCKPLEATKRTDDISDSVSQALHCDGRHFHEPYCIEVVSRTNRNTGVLLLFSPQLPQAQEDRMHQTILPVASRLAGLACEYWSMHERLLHEARNDVLTGLPNRAVAEDRLEQALARAQRNTKMFAVLCIDLDGFKAINDEFGHDAGDEVLRTLAGKLGGRMRHSDTLARMGGDEFCAILEDCSDTTAAHVAAQAILTALDEPVCPEGDLLRISASIGVALYPADGANAAQLKRHADQAMYRAKSKGGGQISFWSGCAGDANMPYGPLPANVAR